MTQYVFGTGQLYSIPTGGGNPLRIGALQDVSVEFSGDVKQLYGQYQFPLDVARGKTKIEGKIGSGNIDVAAFNTLFFGQTVTGTSEKKQAINEAGTVPASSTYTVTVANAATFSLDLGVTDVLTGNPLTQVASSPSANQYSVSSVGVYTFNVAQASKAMLFNYLYTATTTNSGTLNLTNQLMGTTPKFQLVASQTYNSKTFTLMLYAITTEKLSLPLKQDDHLITEMSFSAFSDDLNRIGYMSTTSATGGGA